MRWCSFALLLDPILSDFFPSENQIHSPPSTFSFQPAKGKGKENDKRSRWDAVGCRWNRRDVPGGIVAGRRKGTTWNRRVVVRASRTAPVEDMVKRVSISAGGVDFGGKVDPQTARDPIGFLYATCPRRTSQRETYRSLLRCWSIPVGARIENVPFPSILPRTSSPSAGPSILAIHVRSSKDRSEIAMNRRSLDPFHSVDPSTDKQVRNRRFANAVTNGTVRFASEQIHLVRKEFSTQDLRKREELLDMIFYRPLALLSPPLLWIPKQAYLITVVVLFVLVLLHQRARRAFKKRLQAFEAEKNYDVHVRVISAENLLAADATGASDPYVTVEYAHLSLSTGMRIQTLFPVWNETLRFPVQSIGEHGEILFTVYDWDLFSADDFLGRASLKLRGKLDISRILKEEVKLWLPLHGVPKGRIQVGLRVAPSEKRKSKEGAAHVKFLEKRRKKFHSTVGKIPPGYMESILGLPEGETLLEGGFGASILANKQLLMGMMFITENFLCFHLNDTHPSGLYSSAVVLPLLDILNASPRDIDVIQPSIPGVMVQVKPLSKVEAKEGEKHAADENQDLLEERLEYLLPWSMDGGGTQQLRKFQGDSGKERPVQFFFSEFRDGWRRSDILDFFKSVAKHIAEVAGAEEDTEATGPLIRVTQPELIFEEEILAPCSSLWTWCYDTGATVQQKHFEARKEFDIDILPWKVAPEGTNILMRSLKLKSPIRIPFAPPVAHVKKRQRCLQGKGSFTIEEASVTPNVPYGDCFVVESTWKYQDLKPGVCKVEVYAGVYFTKNTMMKGKIKSSSVSSMKEAVQLFVSLAKEEAGRRSG